MLAHLRRPRAASLLIAAAALAAAVAPASSLLAQAPVRHTLGTSASVYNLVGTVRLEAGSGSGVEVEVTPRGAEAARVRVETGEVNGRRAVRVVYPSDRIRYEPMGRRSSTTMTVREDGTWGSGGAGARRVRITGDEGIDARADVVVRVPRGASVKVWLGVGEATARNVDGDVVIDVASATVDVAGARGTLLLDTGSGDVKVADVDARLTVDAGSGDVTLENVRGDEVMVDGGSGDITARGVRARRAVFDLGSGSTRLSGVAVEELIVDSGSGSVDVALVSGVRSMVLDTGSGDVVLRVPADFGASLDVDTGSGGIEADMPITITRRSRSSLVGTIGDGRGRVRIDTGSGSVRLVRGG